MEKQNTKTSSITFISPSRNNLSYLKWMYNSIRKNIGYRHEILLADDFSTDGTWEWLQEIKKTDHNVQIFRNEGPERKGIVYWYDYLCEKASNDVVMFLHADMYVTPKLDEEILKHIKPGVVVTATRIEPSLHPPGPEKILADYGIEPEEFDEHQFLRDLDKFKQNKTTEGVFAPWAIYKDDYWAVGGHDKLFAPQSKEDSDIFNRLHLNGCKFIQTWDGFVYHMTSRGSRFNPMAGGAPGKDSPEWLHTTTKNMRNFIRKWGTMVKHDELMKPIVVPKYDIGFVVKNCNGEMIQHLEPFCNTLYVDTYAEDYISAEQPNTLYDLNKRIYSIDDNIQNDIVVKFDGSKLTNESFQIIQQLPEIISNDEGIEDDTVGEFDLGIFKIMINSVRTYEEELIKCER
jgi:glycosyltransferase involved in cell wall biosynthesis